MAESSEKTQPGSGTKPATVADASETLHTQLEEMVIRTQDIGLKVLYEPQDIDEIEIDVVAVHGIAAHPNTTWTHKETGKNWLSDPTMLPSALPQARIMAFGYNSAWYGKKPVRQSLDSVSNKLLKALVYERKDAPCRPILLIGHCFGGLVLKEAYNKATGLEADAPYIARSIIGMVFLGTPHQGLNEKSLLSTEGAVYTAIVKSGTQVQDNALRTMAQDSDVLVGAMSTFHRSLQLKKSPLQLFCFFEEVPTKLGKIAGLDVPAEFVINQKSGTLDHADKEGLPLDHFHINKFEDKDDNNYKCVRNQIVKMAQASREFMENDFKGKALTYYT